MIKKKKYRNFNVIIKQEDLKSPILTLGDIKIKITPDCIGVMFPKNYRINFYKNSLYPFIVKIPSICEIRMFNPFPVQSNVIVSTSYYYVIDDEKIKRIEWVWFKNP